MTGFKHFARLGPAVSGVASVALLALAVGCGGEEAAQMAPPEAAVAPVEMVPGEYEVPMAGGEVAMITAGELPKDFPSDLPVPPDSEPKNALFIPGQGGLATFTSTTSRADLVTYFKQELPSQGWSVDSTTPGKDRVTIKATKEGRTTNVMIASGVSGTEISIQVQGG